jgi:hypothetical protein
MSAKDDETEDMLSPMPPHIVPKREKTKSDMSRFAEEEMMGSLVRRRRVRYSMQVPQIHNPFLPHTLTHFFSLVI